jgi:hypothetical protein
MTCDGCLEGIQGSVDQLLAPETIDKIINMFVESDLCSNFEIDDCPTIIDMVIRNGLPLLASSGDPADFGEICNAVAPGTCFARKFAKLF